jgi:redox-sensing transcriptional repressor
MGNLGRALAAYRGFAERGFRVIALLDGDPRVVGAKVSGQRVRPMTDLGTLVTDEGLAIGVIATPSEGAQRACDDLVAAGVRSVLNFAPAVLAVPDGVVVRKVDLSTELQILAFHGQKAAVPEVVPT